MASLPWLSRPPQFDCDGFLSTRGLIVINAGYADYGGPVLLYAVEHIGTTKRLWRSFWTTRDNAAIQAEILVGDIEEYLETIPATPRTSENLNLDDFIQHITERYQNGLH